MRARATTLIELLVYMALFLVVMGLVLSIFRSATRTGASASSSFLLGQDASLSFDKLRRDFQDTSLQSIRVTPGKGQSWISMAGARASDGSLKISRYGVPQWQSYVCYELQPDADNDGVSTLVRYEIQQTFPGSSPLPADKALQSPVKVTAILNQVVAPGYKLNAGKDGVTALQADPQSVEGGFSVRFVRHQANGPDQLSTFNPNQKTDDDEKGWSQGSTSMVDLQVNLAEINSTTGKVSSIQIPIRVTPRH